MDTHFFHKIHIETMTMCACLGFQAYGLKNALQSGSMNIGLFDIQSTALAHACALMQKQWCLLHQRVQATEND